MPYHQKMAKEAQLRSKVVYDGRAEAGRQRILVEPERRRGVEEFASRLTDMETPATTPQRAEFARMDASALLSKLARGSEELLEVLRNAVLSQDMEAFVDALDANQVGSKLDRNNLRHFVTKQDREAIAASLRLLARSADERPMQEVAQVDVGIEMASPFYPLMGDNRRLRCTTYLRGNNLHDPVRFRRPPNSEAAPMTATAISLGDATDHWEQSMLYHPYMLDGANAAMDLMSEAAGYGHLDGRIDGSSGSLNSM